MKRRVIDVQKQVLMHCLNNGVFVLQRKKFSKLNEAANLAVKAGLMRHIGERQLVLTEGGKVKAKQLRG